MSWKSLVKTALLGTERSNLPPETLAFLEAQGIDPQKEPTEVLLEAAALFSQMNKAGFLLKDYEGGLPETIGENDEQACSPKSSHHLSLILDDTFAEALPEFIFHLNHNRKQLPPTSLPNLLEQCKEDRALWQKINPAIGKRGRWLMRLNPDWAILIAKPEISSWKTSQKAERIALLKHLREIKSTETVPLLQSSWAEESVSDKVDFLKILEIGITQADEFFLEDCLYDSRKEVRQVAANLLAQIPDSELVERMHWRVSTSMVYERGQLILNLPDELDETAIRDGISPTLKSYKSGLKAGWFGQMMAKVPPYHWESFFAKKPTEILELFSKSDWIGMLVQAIVEATILYKDEKWMEAILRLWLKHEDYPIWQIDAMKDLLEIIPDALFNEIALKSLKKTKGLLEENSPVTKLLTLGKHDWNDQLTLLIIKRFQTWLRDASTFHWNTWHYKKMLQSAAYKCNPSLYDALKSGWAYHSPAWGMWEKEVEYFLKVLVFRKEMIGELEKSHR